MAGDHADGALIGRADEMRELPPLLVDTPCVLTVEGEAGVGKSRLVRELVGALPAKTTVLVGQCYWLREPLLYGAVLAALRGARPRLAGRPKLSALVGDLRGLLPELADVLPESTPMTLPRPQRHRVFRAVRELLAALGHVVLVVEDVQWADDGTRDLLAFLVADPPAGLAVVLTRRDNGPLLRTGLGVRTLTRRVRPLDVRDTGELAAAILGVDAVSPALAARLHERTAGIPFVIEETVPNLTRIADPSRVDDVTVTRLLDTADVPALLRDSVREQLDGVSATTRQVVEAVAVFGAPTTAHMIVAVTGEHPEKVNRALVEALERRLLVEDANKLLAFRHSLAWQAVYDSLTAVERRHLHGRCLRALEIVHPPPLVQIAWHAREADDWTRWLRAGEAAADSADENGEASLAVALLCEMVPDERLGGDDLARLALKLGAYGRRGGDLTRATTALRAVLDDPRLPGDAWADIWIARVILMGNQGRLGEARTELEAGLPRVADRPEIAAQAAVVLMVPINGTVPVAECTRWVEERRTHLGRVADPALRADLAGKVLTARLYAGESAAFPDLADQLERDILTDRWADARLRQNAADACVHLGLFAEADALLTSARLLMGTLMPPFSAIIQQALTVRTRWFTGHWQGLAGTTQDALADHGDNDSLRAEFSLVLGWLAVTTGAWAAAERHFADTGTAWHRNAIAPLALAGHGGLIRVHLGQGDLRRANDEADQGIDLLRRKGTGVWAGELLIPVIDCYLAAERPHDARAAIDFVTEGLADRTAPLAAAALLVARGKIAAVDDDIDTAVELLHTARDAYSAMGVPYYATIAAEAAMSRTDTIDPETLSRVMDDYAGLGATADVARCKRLYASRKPRGRPGFGPTLSPRELDVARLVAAGHTNRAIAGQLRLAVRTVDLHVTRVLRKLAVTSRRHVDEALRAYEDSTH